MATNLQSKYAAAVALTITLDSLANSSGSTARQSTAVDNTLTLALDAKVNLKIVTGASGVSSTGYLNVWGYTLGYGGSTYTDGLAGTDGATTLTLSSSNLRFLGRVNATANATTYYASMSVASGWDFMPDAWGIVVENVTGAALGTGNAAEYVGIGAQAV